MEQFPSLDYSTIAQRVGGVSLVGMGESTHGTHEFFETKAEVFKLLITDYGFDTLFFESVDDHCDSLSAYLETGDGDLEGLVNNLFYFYRSHEVLDLFNWLRDHYDEHPVRVVGIDERKYVDDYTNNYDLGKMNLRDKRMALVIKRHMGDNPNSKAMIWAHDTHVAAYVNAPFSYKEQFAPMGRHLRRWYKKDYYNVAQLFGLGEFSAELINEMDNSEKGNLISISVPPVPNDFWEYKLSEQINHPAFIEGPTFDGIAEPHEIHKKRALGWGVKEAEIDDGFIWIDMYHAFDALTFFPHATASHRLEKS